MGLGVEWGAGWVAQASPPLDQDTAETAVLPSCRVPAGLEACTAEFESC